MEVQMVAQYWYLTLPLAPRIMGRQIQISLSCGWGLALELEPDPVCTLWERFWFAQTIHLHMAKECSLSWLEISVGEKIERKLGRHLQISELDYSYNVEALFLCLVMMGWPIDDIKRLRKALLGFIFFLRFDALCRLNHFVVCPIQL